MREDLIVYNIAGQKLAILNNFSEHPAYNIKLSKNLNAVNQLTFDISLKSDNMIYCINENIVSYKNQDYFINDMVIAKSMEANSVTITCNHVCSILSKQINQNIDLVEASFTDLVNTVLAGSGWSLGVYDTIDTSKHNNLKTENNSKFANLITITEMYDAFMKFDSMSHKVNFYTLLPDRQIYIRYRYNLKGINLIYNDDDIVTKLYVNGGEDDVGVTISIMDMPTETDSNGIHHENGDSFLTCYKYYIDQGITQEYIDAHPEKFLHEQTLNLSDYKDVSELYEMAKIKMSKKCVPIVTCSINMLDFSQYPEYSGELIDETPIDGEIIWIVDEDLGETLSAQVTNVVNSEENPMAIDIQISNVIEYKSLASQLIDSSNKVKQSYISNRVKGSYINGVIDLLTARLNSTMSGVSTDANGNLLIESSDKTGCFKLAGGIFALGSRTTAQRDAGIDYNYRSFGDSDGFTADEIVVGILKGGKVSFDLEKGTLLIGNSIDDYILYFDGVNLNLKNISIINKDSNGNIIYSLDNKGNLIAGNFESNKEHARFTANDGSYTEFVPESTGLRWHKTEGDEGKDYHYLSYMTTISVTDDLVHHVLQLPDEFKRKNFTFSRNICGFGTSIIPSFVNVISIYVVSVDYTNAKIEYYLDGWAFEAHQSESGGFTMTPLSVTISFFVIA